MGYFVRLGFAAFCACIPIAAQAQTDPYGEDLSLCLEAEDSACVYNRVMEQMQDRAFVRGCRQGMTEPCNATVGLVIYHGFLLSEQLVGQPAQRRNVAQAARDTIDTLLPGFADYGSLFDLVEGEACLDLGNLGCAQALREGVGAFDRHGAHSGARAVFEHFEDNPEARISSFFANASGG